jgi:hypothetical protein
VLSPAAFFRKTPPPLLQLYFSSKKIALPDFAVGDLPTTTLLLRALEHLESRTREQVLNDFDRVNAMADEAGQNALYGVVGHRNQLDSLNNGQARALWIYIYEPETFRRAEESRYTDDHRRGRNWSGFSGSAGVMLKANGAQLAAFQNAVQERFGSRNVHVDIFSRRRKRLEKDDIELIQATVYFEGRPEQILEFVNAKLDLRDHRPVIEAAITYDPLSGSIEVVAGDGRSREEFVRLFAETFLAIRFESKSLPVLSYDLEILRHPFNFPTEPHDGIESVRITSLRLMPLNTASQRVTLECMRNEAGSIWEMSTSRFGANDPLAGGWLITQVKFTITFRGATGSGRPKKLPVTITMPHQCNLKDRTDRERIIGEKYLRRWRLLHDL